MIYAKTKQIQHKMIIKRHINNHCISFGVTIGWEGTTCGILDGFGVEISFLFWDFEFKRNRKKSFYRKPKQEIKATWSIV